MLYDLLNWSGKGGKYFIYDLVYTMWYKSTGRKTGQLVGNFSLGRRT
jgi:hypothetical protein